MRCVPATTATASLDFDDAPCRHYPYSRPLVLELGFRSSLHGRRRSCDHLSPSPFPLFPSSPPSVRRRQSHNDFEALLQGLKACMEAREPVPEEPYEISCDVHGSLGGPRTGRLRAMQKAQSLFAGLTFYFSVHFMPTYKVYLEDLIATAGGLILDKANLSSTSLIVYSMDPPQGSDLDTLNEVIKRRMAEAEELAGKIGCRAIPHTRLLDSIASCKVQLLM